MGAYKWLLHPRHQCLQRPTSRQAPSQWQVKQMLSLIIIFILSLPVSSGISVLPEFLESYTNVPMEPIFLNTDVNITVREGGKASLPCSIQHLGTKKVAWRSVDQDKFMTIGTMAWSPDDDIQVDHVKHSEELEDWTLIFPKVKKSDSGLYECQLTSVAGYHTLVRLIVVGPPISNPVLTNDIAEVTLTGTQFVERGGQIQLQCNATGGEQIAEQIDWFKDGNIVQGKKFQEYVIYNYRLYEHGALVSTLHVDRASNHHAGTYVCRSSENKLKDISVQVLVADSSNVKRGTVSSSNNSSSCPLHQSTFCIFIGLVVTHWKIS